MRRDECAVRATVLWFPPVPRYSASNIGYVLINPIKRVIAPVFGLGK